MKALTYHGAHDVRVETMPDPRLIAAADIILRVTTTAMHLLSAAMLAIAIGATILTRAEISLGARIETDVAQANGPFLRFVALSVGGFFSLVIAGFWLVQWLMSPCL